MTSFLYVFFFMTDITKFFYLEELEEAPSWQEQMRFFERVRDKMLGGLYEGVPLYVIAGAFVENTYYSTTTILDDWVVVERLKQMATVVCCGVEQYMPPTVERAFILLVTGHTFLRIERFLDQDTIDYYKALLSGSNFFHE